MEKRVCVVGLDGANLPLFRHYFQNKVPNMILTNMRTILPPYTPAAWTSLLTGVEPDNHGIYGFLKLSRRGRIPRIVYNTSFDVKFPRIFEILSAYNLKSVVINAPLTYPIRGLIRPKNYVVVSDWACPKLYLWPPRLNLRYKEYLVPPPHEWWAGASVEEYVKTIQDYTRNRLTIYYDMLEEIDWTLFFIIFSETDWLLHRLPQILRGHATNAVRNLFAEIARFIARACTISDLTIVVSDHGFRRKKWAVNVNRYLEKYGMLKFTISPSHKRVRYSMSAKNMLKFSILTLADVASKCINLEKLLRINALRRKIRLEVDLTKSKALMLECDGWGVYALNKNEIGKLRDILSSIPGVIKVYSKEEIFRGPYIDEFPDFVIIPHKEIEFRVSPARPYLSRIEEGGHDFYGIFGIYGDEVQSKGALPHEVSILDITPTILYYLNLPVTKEMKNRIIKSIFTFRRKVEVSEKIKLLHKLARYKSFK